MGLWSGLGNMIVNIVKTVLLGIENSGELPKRGHRHLVSVVSPSWRRESEAR